MDTAIEIISFWQSWVLPLGIGFFCGVMFALGEIRKSVDGGIYAGRLPKRRS